MRDQVNQNHTFVAIVGCRRRRVSCNVSCMESRVRACARVSRGDKDRLKPRKGIEFSDSNSGLLIRSVTVLIIIDYIDEASSRVGNGNG
jgi:hypothetical protein